MQTIVNRITQLKPPRYSDALEPARKWADREVDAERYRVTRDVRGERILVLDDTFTSGATIFSG